MALPRSKRHDRPMSASRQAAMGTLIGVFVGIVVAVLLVLAG
jgi:hypothetical protein